MLSYKENIPRILQAVEKSGAKKILDVGCAYGKYGLLLREQYLSKKAEKEITPVDDFLIDAVEYTKYFYNRPELKYIYNKVIKGSIFDVKDFSKYELVLLIDIVEHYTKEEMRDLFKKIGKPILVSTPKKVVMYKEYYYGDDHPHVSQWNKEDFEGGTDFSTDLSHIYII